MIQDEYGRLPEEFAPLGDEFNSTRQQSGKKQEPQRQTQKTARKMTRLLRAFAGSAAVLVVAGSPLSVFGGTKIRAQSIGSGQNMALGAAAAVIETQEQPTEEHRPIEEHQEAGLPTAENGSDTTAQQGTGETTAPEQLPEEPAPPETQVYQVCEACLGSQLCSECHNNGYVQCENISDGCALCHGNGVRLCSSCGGAGQCSACGGTGVGNREVEQFYIQCGACEGRGILCPGSAAADDPEGCHGSVVVRCLACRSTGREADGSPCNWCKGTLHHLCPSFENHYACPTCGGSGMELRTEG